MWLWMEFIYVWMWTIFKVFIEFVTIFLLFYVFCFLVFLLWGMRNLSSQTRDWTHIPYFGRRSLNHWTTGEVPVSVTENVKIFLLIDPSISSVQFSCSVMSNSLRPHESQHARHPCPSPTPGVHSNSCPSSWWCHPAISSSVVPFSSCPQSLPASGSFPMSQLFASGGQSIGVSDSASVLPMNTQDWPPLGWTGWISL